MKLMSMVLKYLDFLHYTFFKGSDKPTPTRYEGGRDLDSLSKFISDNAHNSISTDEL